MKHISLISLFLFWSALFGNNVKIRVVDDQGIAVPGASATIEFVGYLQTSGKAYRGMTNINGEFSAIGQAEDSVFFAAFREGYYEAKLYRLPKDKELDLVIVIPRILNPIPLYVKRVNLTIPVQNNWVGYDLEIADWVSPFGEGKVADIRFKIRTEFKGWKYSERDLARSRKVNSQLSEKEFKDFYGKWDAELEVSFPNESEGIHEETRFLTYCSLQLPHMAPEHDYARTWHYISTNYTPRTSRENIGFFLRTRVKLDKEGNVISANYTKLIGDIHMATTGVLLFTYYYNPTPNDRNLEFDPGRNLFPSALYGTDVRNP